MTATNFDPSVAAERPFDARSVGALLIDHLSRSVDIVLHAFAEYDGGQLVTRFTSDDTDAEASYRMLRLVEGHLDRDGRVARVYQLPHAIDELEGRALVVVEIAHDGRRLGVAIASSASGLDESGLDVLHGAAQSLAEPLAHHLGELRVAERDGEARLSREISVALAESFQLPRLVPVIARAVAEAAGFERATVLLWRPDGGLEAGASEFVDGQPDIRLWGAFRAMHAAIPGISAVLSADAPIAYEVAEQAVDLEPERWIRPFGIRSVLLVPLVDRGDHLGVAILDNETRLRIDRDRMRAAKRIADQGAITIGIARMIQRERAARQRTQMVLGTVVQAATQMNTSGVLTVIAEGINAVLSDATTVAFVMRDRRAARLAVCGRGDGAVDLIDALTSPEMFPDGEAPFQRDFAGPIQLNAGDGTVPILSELGIGRVLVAPVRRAARELGWVVSYDRSTVPYLEDDLKVVSGISAQAALSLHTATLLEGERATVARLEELDRLKTAFVAAVSHELRTPLTAIVGFSEILAEQLEDPALGDFLEDLRREAAVLEALIGNLLDTSRLEAGLLQLNLQLLDIRGVVFDAIDVVRHGYRDREIRVDIDESLDPVIVDQVRLRQVFVNLLENAAKYSPSGTPIDLSVHITSDPDRVLSIRVDDAGQGIPPEHREAVFQRFHRLSTHQSKPGTGIGLYLVRALVEAHGGTITVGERPDGEEGASFVVTLPLVQGDVTVGA